MTQTPRRLLTPGLGTSVAVFLAALALRLTAIQLTFADQFFFGKYLVLGRALHDSGMIADRAFSYAPIYTYFIAVCTMLFGESLWPVLALQAVIGSLGCVLVLLIARRLIGPRWALVPAALACVHRSFVLYDVTLLSDSLGLVIQLALLLALLHVTPQARHRVFVVVGGCVGLSILHRPNNLLLLPLIALVLLVTSRDEWRRGLRRVAIVTAVAFAVTLPVVLQNVRLTGTPGITASNPGYIFFSSNNAASHGSRYSPPELFYRGAAYYERQDLQPDATDPRFLGDAEIATMISGAIEGRPMSLRESSRFYRRFTLDHIRRYPVHYASLGLQRLWLAFNGYEAHDVQPVFARYDAVAGITPIRFGWIVPLGLLGLGLSLRRGASFRWLHVLILNNLVLLVVFYVTERFRLPLEAMLVILSGPAVVTLVEWARARRFRVLAAAVVGLALLLIACRWMPPAAAERARAGSFQVLLEDAQRRLRRGDPVGAASRLESLVGRDAEEGPRALAAHRLLTEIYRRSAAPTDATAMRSPAEFAPHAVVRRLEGRRAAGEITYRELQYLAFAQMQAGSWPEARVVLLDALDRRPFDPTTGYQLARVEWVLHEVATAADHLSTAIDDGLLFTSSGLDGTLLMARISREQGDDEQRARWIRLASRLSILAPWWSGDAGAAASLAELRAAREFVDPGELDALIPLGAR